MKPTARVLFFLIGLLCLGSGAGIAQPEVSPQQLARQLFDDGVAMAKRGDHHQAADAFAQAWDLDGKPEYMRERATALRNAGQTLGAIASRRRRSTGALKRPDRTGSCTGSGPAARRRPTPSGTAA